MISNLTLYSHSNNESNITAGIKTFQMGKLSRGLKHGLRQNEKANQRKGREGWESRKRPNLGKGGALQKVISKRK